MNTDSLFYQIFDTPYIKDGVQNLTAFYDKVSKIRNRKRIIAELLSQAKLQIIPPSVMVFGRGSQYYKIAKENQAVRNWGALKLHLNRSVDNAPNDIGFIRLTIEQALSFDNTPTPIVLSEFINEFMTYMDGEYQFSKCINNIIFNYIGARHGTLNGETFMMSSTKCGTHIFLYNIRTNEEDYSPEHVMFHELAHAVQNIYNNKTDTYNVPPQFAKYVVESGKFRNANLIPHEDMAELFADFISLGMVYNTPYEKYHYYSYISGEEKKALHNIFMQIIEGL